MGFIQDLRHFKASSLGALHAYANTLRVDIGADFAEFKTTKLTYGEKLCVADVVDRLQLKDQLCGLLLESDKVFVDRLTRKCGWFFSRIQNPCPFVREFLPQLSLSARLRVIARYGACLQDQFEAGEFFNLLHSTYGWKQALPVLQACSTNLIKTSLDKIPFKLHRLFANQICKRNPEAAVLCYRKLATANSPYQGQDAYISDLWKWLTRRDHRTRLLEQVLTNTERSPSWGVSDLPISNRDSRWMMKHRPDLFEDLLVQHFYIFKLGRMRLDQLRKLAKKLLPASMPLHPRDVTGMEQVLESLKARIDRWRFFQEICLQKYGQTVKLEELFENTLWKSKVLTHFKSCRVEYAEAALQWTLESFERAELSVYLPISDSVPLLKSIINGIADSDDRARFVSFFFDTAVNNKRYDALPAVVKWLNFRFKSDKSSIRRQLLRGLDQFSFLDLNHHFTATDLNYFLEILTLMRRNNETDYCNFPSKLCAVLLHKSNFKSLLEAKESLDNYTTLTRAISGDYGYEDDATRRKFSKEENCYSLSAPFELLGWTRFGKEWVERRLKSLRDFLQNKIMHQHAWDEIRKRVVDELRNIRDFNEYQKQKKSVSATAEDQLKCPPGAEEPDVVIEKPLKVPDWLITQIGIFDRFCIECSPLDSPTPCICSSLEPADKRRVWLFLEPLVESIEMARYCLRQNPAIFRQTERCDNEVHSQSSQPQEGFSESVRASSYNGVELSDDGDDSPEGLSRGRQDSSDRSSEDVTEPGQLSNLTLFLVHNDHDLSRFEKGFVAELAKYAHWGLSEEVGRAAHDLFVKKLNSHYIHKRSYQRSGRQPPDFDGGMRPGKFKREKEKESQDLTTPEEFYRLANFLTAAKEDQSLLSLVSFLEPTETELKGEFYGTAEEEERKTAILRFRAQTAVAKALKNVVCYQDFFTSLQSYLRGVLLVHAVPAMSAFAYRLPVPCLMPWLTTNLKGPVSLRKRCLFCLMDIATVEEKTRLLKTAFEGLDNATLKERLVQVAFRDFCRQPSTDQLDAVRSCLSSVTEKDLELLNLLPDMLDLYPSKWSITGANDTAEIRRNRVSVFVLVAQTLLLVANELTIEARKDTIISKVNSTVLAHAGGSFCNDWCDYAFQKDNLTFVGDFLTSSVNAVDARAVIDQRLAKVFTVLSQWFAQDFDKGVWERLPNTNSRDSQPVFGLRAKALMFVEIVERKVKQSLSKLVKAKDWSGKELSNLQYLFSEFRESLKSALPDSSPWPLTFRLQLSFTLLDKVLSSTSLDKEFQIRELVSFVHDNYQRLANNYEDAVLIQLIVGVVENFFAIVYPAQNVPSQFARVLIELYDDEIYLRMALKMLPSTYKACDSLFYQKVIERINKSSRRDVILETAETFLLHLKMGVD